MSTTILRRRASRALLAAVALVAGLCALASTSQAACSYPDAEQVFSQWGDDNYYELAPDGGFEEGGAGWAFTGGAEIVDGNETEYLNGDEDDTSLSLPYGGVATSPTVCVDSSTPVFRLMALNGGDGRAKLRVVVNYLSNSGGTNSRTTDLRADGEWEPTEPLRLDANGDRERAARISFTPRDDDGEWLVDDLYIDPFARR